MNQNSKTPKVSTKKNGNHLNSSIRFRSSSSDMTINQRKSFPSCSSLNSHLQSQEILNGNNQYVLTQAGLEEYSRSYYEQNVVYNHQKQSSYAQSEGYHSYVSSSDSTSTPFLDRLRKESYVIQSRDVNMSDMQTEKLNGSNNSISSSTGNIKECSDSNSSTETLKWLGSMSDVSLASQATNTSTLSAASSKLIVHSSKVHTPQRHNSESVLYMNEESIDFGSNLEDTKINCPLQRSSRSDNRLFPINTYTENSIVQENNSSLSMTSLSSPEVKTICSQPWQSVADRISELENQQQQLVINDHIKQSYTYLDPSKTNRVSSSTLKAFQKNAVQSYFERQQQNQQSLRLSKSKNNAEFEDQVKLRKSEPDKKIFHCRPSNSTLYDNLSTASQRSSLPNWPSDASNKINNHPNNLIKNFNEKSSVRKNTKCTIPVGSSVDQSNDKNHNTSFTSFCEIKADICTFKNMSTATVQNNKHSDISINENNNDIPPPLPRKTCILRRTSSASEYSSARDKMLHQSEQLSKDLLAPMILGKIISIDEWVPERPPKPKNMFGNMLPSLRIPSPDLPDLSSPPLLEESKLYVDNNESLPLPPLEILKPNSDIKSSQPSRRNSFAGQSSLQQRTMITLNKYKSPPAVPMRPKIIPTPIMTINQKQSSCLKTEDHSNLQPLQTTMQQQYLNEQNVLNCFKQEITSPFQAPHCSSDQRIPVRKRAHNSSPKDCIGYINQIPPPLKPRMRNQNESNTQTLLNNNNDVKTRSNSKASYLPRQQRDKLLDPDHGSYKLTLHEPYDTINVEYQENLSKCNLPDVLPVNVKYHNSYRNVHFYHHQHVKPPHFYSSDSNLVPQSAPTLEMNPGKSIFNFQMNANQKNNSAATPIQSLTSPSFSNRSLNASLSSLQASLQSPKYTSQSSIDFKMTQIIDPKSYANDELIKVYQQQTESNRELNRINLCDSLKSTQSFNECDNKIAIVRKLNMVESTDISEGLKNVKYTASVESLEEKAVNEKSEKQIKFESLQYNNNDNNNNNNNNGGNHEHIDEAIDINPKALQKTEIVLTVNEKIDMACQTDENLETDKSFLWNEENNKISSTLKVHQHAQCSEEIDCEKLSKDLISQLSPSDKLHNILVPKKVKSSADYISDLFKLNVTLRPTKKDVSTSTLEKTSNKSSTELLTSNSTYFSISEPKAKLMTRYSREMTLLNNDSSDLTKKKEELVERLAKKLKILETEQTILAEENSINDSLGNELAFKITQKLKPGDSTRFRSHVDDIGYVTMLLLSLSGRLARIENALHSIAEITNDKKILENKRDKLMEQLDEAKCLKEDIDRRGSILSKTLQQCLTQEEYADYDYFINMKAKLIVDSREIADKIKLGEEQLNALKDTLNHSEC